MYWEEGALTEEGQWSLIESTDPFCHLKDSMALNACAVAEPCALEKSTVIF